MYVISRLRLDCAVPATDNEEFPLMKVVCVTKGYINGYLQFLSGERPSCIREQPFHIALNVFKILETDQVLNSYYSHEVAPEKHWTPLIKKMTEIQNTINHCHNDFADLVRDHIRITLMAIKNGKVQDELAEDLAKPKVRFQ